MQLFLTSFPWYLGACRNRLGFVTPWTRSFNFSRTECSIDCCIRWSTRSLYLPIRRAKKNLIETRCNREVNYEIQRKKSYYPLIIFNSLVKQYSDTKYDSSIPKHCRPWQMILKSIIMLSAFVTFVLPILHRLGLICVPRLTFYSSCFLFLLGQYSRPPPLSRKWNNENNAYPKFVVRTRQKRAIRQWWIAVKTEYYDKLCSVIMLLISRPCAYLHCNYIISRIQSIFSSAQYQYTTD